MAARLPVVAAAAAALALMAGERPSNHQQLRPESQPTQSIKEEDGEDEIIDIADESVHFASDSEGDDNDDDIDVDMVDPFMPFADDGGNDNNNSDDEDDDGRIYGSGHPYSPSPSPSPYSSYSSFNLSVMPPPAPSPAAEPAPPPPSRPPPSQSLLSPLSAGPITATAAAVQDADPRPPNNLMPRPAGLVHAACLRCMQQLGSMPVPGPAPICSFAPGRDVCRRCTTANRSHRECVACPPEAWRAFNIVEYLRWEAAEGHRQASWEECQRLATRVNLNVRNRLSRGLQLARQGEANMVIDGAVETGAWGRMTSEMRVVFCGSDQWF